MTADSANNSAQIPLLIGVTGHRDLVPEEIDPLRAAVRGFLTKLRSQFPDAPLLVATSLAQGADLLVAEEALALDIDCFAVLPLPLELYRADFTNAVDWRRFEEALARCRQSMVCSSEEAGSSNAADVQGPLASRYTAAGELIASDAFILLALWDGRLPEKRAGTARTVEFRLSQRAWLDDEGSPEPRELLPTLPPDLVYHIVTSRQGRSPLPGLAPLQQGYRRTLDGPLETDLPESAVILAARTSELDRDLRRHHVHVAGGVERLSLIGDLATLPQNAIESARLYHAIASVAAQMRRNVVRTLFLTSALSLAMGLFFLLFSHSDGNAPYSYAIFGFVAAFAAMAGANQLARSRQWQRRYLEYRTLAEGLRVELFWALAGVASRGPTGSVHRTLLKQSDPSLEWIPNAIRSTGLMLEDVRRHGIPGGIEFAMRRWVGTSSDVGAPSEQLHYYKHSSRYKAVRADAADRIAGGAALAGFVIAAILAAQLFFARGSNHVLLLGAIGLLPLIGGVIDSLVQKTAARELQRQYEYMYDVFQAARDRLLAARSDEERRGILALLGRSALAEHAEWLLMHRDRPIDRSRLQ